MFIKKNIHKVYFLFLVTHLLLWTLIPSITNVNLPLDTIEALAWGSNLDWGFNKHPPFSAFAVEMVYRIFGNQDWAYYLLSQIFVISAFIVVFKLANEFFNDINFAFFSVILLEGIFFFNYTSPEFNVNISQLPFWALSILFSWRCLKNDSVINYIFLGISLGLGFLSKYIFLYLIIGIKLLFVFLLIKKKIKSYKFLIPGFVSLLIIFPHLIWLSENNYITITYGLQRAGVEDSLLNHFYFPFTFILKQFGILLPFLIMVFFLVKKIRFKKFKFDEKMIFLFFTFVVPILLIIFTSLIMGSKIRTMWMTPFYLFAGVTIIYIFKNELEQKKIKQFYIIFIFLFLLSPATYTFVALSNDFKRTDYPGKEISRLVQSKWDDNYRNEIKVVVGDEWFAGNLSYHLRSRPKWIMELKEKSNNIKSSEGVIYTGNPKILKNICPGVFGTIKPVGYCMIGQR